MKLSTKMKAGATAVAGSAVLASGASALTSTFTVAIEFFDPFTISEAIPADFGRVISGVATTYALSTGNVVTAGAGGSATGGAPAAGSFSIADSSSGGAVDVIVNNPTTDGGVTINSFNCLWNGVTALNGASCSYNAVANPAAAGQTLLVGFGITVDGTQASLDTANPGFDITVAYD